MIRRRNTVSDAGVVVLLALLLAACVSSTEPAEERLNIRGEITLLQTQGLQHQQALAEIIIEEDPSISRDEWMKNPTGSRKIIYTVLPTTKIYRQIAYETLVEIDLEMLVVGATVRAWNTGYVVHTLLPRAYAERIILVVEAQ